MAPIYDPKSYDPLNGIGRLLSQVRGVLFEALEQELQPFDITAAQYVILVQIANGGPVSASGLCKDISYDPGAMTRMIDRLERKDLIRRVRSLEDRRTVRLELTPDGKAVYPKLLKSAVAVMNRHLRGLTKADVKQLERYLIRILENA